jgi:hypothetical protein
LIRAWLEILRERHPEVTWITAADGPPPGEVEDADRGRTPNGEALIA